MMSWTLAVIIICILLALFFSWQEIIRADKRRLALRLFAIYIALAALACIALPVSYNSTTNMADGSDAILLTEGFVKDSIPANTPVFTTEKSIRDSYPKATLISSVAVLTRHQPAYKKIKISGYGLAADELGQLNNLPISYYAPAPPAGIQVVNWAAQIKTGHKLIIQGKYHNTATGPVQLLLKGLNTTLDSVTVKPGTNNFELSTTPKLTGRVVYQLLALNGNDTLSNDNVPVQIEATKPARVLMLNASPNFETRFLKNWLGQNGYAVASRALISQNKSAEEFVNINKLNLQHLSAGVLDKFDLVIGDLSALKALSAADASALKQQVTQKGLGIIVRADSSDKASSWFERDFPVTTLALKDQLSVALSLQNQKAKTARLNIDPSFIGNRANTQTLVTDAQNRGLAGITIAGAGKLSFTTLNHTYNWILAGNQPDYAALWSLLIGQAARKQLPGQNLNVVSAVPTVHRPVQLQLQGATTVSALINGTPAPAVQDANVPYEWTMKYWPQKTGWQQVNVSNTITQWWYNYPENDWKTLKNLQKIKINQEFSTLNNNKDVVTKQIQQTVKIEVPKIWFYIFLLVACTFLWIERKFST